MGTLNCARKFESDMVYYFIEDKRNKRNDRMNILFFLTPKAEVAHVREDDSLRQVMEKMEHHGYSAIPLLGEDGQYIGTITEGDLLWEMKRLNFPALWELENIKIMSLSLIHI